MLSSALETQQLGENEMNCVKAIIWVMMTVFVTTLMLTADADARGRRGSHRVGGHNSHGKGSHYVGGH